MVSIFILWASSNTSDYLAVLQLMHHKMIACTQRLCCFKIDRRVNYSPLWVYVFQSTLKETSQEVRRKTKRILKHFWCHTPWSMASMTVTLEVEIDTHWPKNESYVCFPLVGCPLHPVTDLEREWETPLAFEWCWWHITTRTYQMPPPYITVPCYPAFVSTVTDPCLFSMLAVGGVMTACVVFLSHFHHHLIYPRQSIILDTCFPSLSSLPLTSPAPSVCR